MPKIPPSVEARYIDLTDEDIMELVGRFHEELMRLKEAKKSDPRILDLKQKIKDLELSQHDGNIKRKSVHLDAVRAIAKMRGLNYE